MGESGFRYGWPNLAKYSRWPRDIHKYGIRGEFERRVTNALSVECKSGNFSYAHIPLNYVKSRPEEKSFEKERIEKKIGDIWGIKKVGEIFKIEEKDIQILFGENYQKNIEEVYKKYKDNQKFGFVFHHEPDDPYNKEKGNNKDYWRNEKGKHILNYGNKDWRDWQILLLTHLSKIIKPIAIEIHPGKNKYANRENLCRFINELRKKLDEDNKKLAKDNLEKTKITLENRNEFMIQTAEDMIEFYKFYNNYDYDGRYKTGKDHFGFALDVEQAYTTVGKSWDKLNDFINAIVDGQKYGYKIHEWHLHDPVHQSVGSGEIFRILDKKDYNNANNLLQIIRNSAKEGALVLPEVQHFSHVVRSIEYIENVLQSENYDDYKNRIKL